MNRCDKCGEYNFMKRPCQCEKFNVIDEDGEEHQVYAATEYFAALKYAEDSNCNGDYYLMNESVEITVNSTKFRISAEPDIHYSADEIETR